MSATKLCSLSRLQGRISACISIIPVGYLFMLWDSHGNTSVGNRVSLSQHQLFGKLKITPVQPSVLRKSPFGGRNQDCCSSVTKLGLTLGDHMGYSMPGSSASTISPYLFRFMSFVLVMLSNHLILCCPVILCLPSFPASGSFPVSQLFTSGGQNIGDLAAVFPMNSHIFPKFSSVIQLYLTICNPWTVARQTSLFITNSWR